MGTSTKHSSQSVKLPLQLLLRGVVTSLHPSTDVARSVTRRNVVAGRFPVPGTDTADEEGLKGIATGIGILEEQGVAGRMGFLGGRFLWRERGGK